MRGNTEWTIFVRLEKPEKFKLNEIINSVRFFMDDPISPDYKDVEVKQDCGEISFTGSKWGIYYVYVIINWKEDTGLKYLYINHEIVMEP